MRPGVILDLDGTLIDTAPAIVSSFAAAFESLDSTPPPEAELRRSIGRGLFDVFREFDPGLTRAQIEAAIDIFREHYEGEARDAYTVFNGVPEALHRLRDEGFALAVVTSKPVTFAKRLLQHANLAEDIDLIMGTGLDERGWRAGKKRIVAKAKRQLGIDPGFILGDRESDIDAGKSAGLAPLGAGWGYGSREELSGAQKVFKTPRQFADWVSSHATHEVAA